MRPTDVAAVVCTKNAISGIEHCLRSLREAGVGQLIVVDAHSTDGTRTVADTLADEVIEDPGTGLGNARNMGIARTSEALILNMGSDNVMPAGQLERMIATLESTSSHGVSARTVVDGGDFVSRGLNAWRRGRFVPGPARIIGTPTLFIGHLLREAPYDPARMFSDDSELCERWSRKFGSRFAISDAYVLEIGKATWTEVAVRCRMYGISDSEVFRNGCAAGWSLRRRAASLTHPVRADFLEPLTRLDSREALMAAPFLAAFSSMRYLFWARQALVNRRGDPEFGPT